MGNLMTKTGMIKPRKRTRNVRKVRTGHISGKHVSFITLANRHVHWSNKMMHVLWNRVQDKPSHQKTTNKDL